MQINSITNLSCFEKNISLDLSKNMTVIFGYNGLGKTSLSRFLKYISNSEQEFDLGRNITTKGSNEDIKWNLLSAKNEPQDKLSSIVYNSDYIDNVITKSNFKENTPNDSGTVIETISFPEKEEYTNLRNIYEATTAEKEKLSAEIDNTLEQRLKQEARVIDAQRMKLAKPETFKEMYSEIKKSPNKNMENDFKSKQKIYKNINEDSRITKILNQDIISNLKSIDQSLKYTEDNSKISFMDDIIKEKRNWLIKGLEYIQEEECPFCNQNIKNNDLIAAYSDYASSKMAEQLRLINENNHCIQRGLDALINSIKSARRELTFYKEINDDYESHDDKLVSCLELLERLNKIVTHKVEEKQSNNNRALSLEQEIIVIENLNDNIEDINNVIETLNQKMNKAKEILTEGKREVLEKSIYPKIKKELDDKFQKLEKTEKTIKEVASKLPNIEKKYRLALKERDPIIGRMNEILIHLNLENYEVGEGFELIHKPSGKYISDEFNKFLSDGEKTAISFALFYCEYKLGLYRDRDFIVIDDPVNSLDYNRIYYIHYLIEEMKSDNKKILLMTHNHIFFNIISYKYNKDNSTIYHIVKSSGSKNKLEKGNTYNSIYLDKVKTIYNFVKKRTKTFSESERAIIPNHCRYILETLAIFHFPSSNRPLSVLEGDLINENKKRIDNNESPIIGKAKLSMLFNVVNKGSHATIEGVHDREMHSDDDFLTACKATIQIVKEYSRNQVAVL